MTARYAISYGSASDVGLVRADNQDAWGAFPVEGADNEPPEALLFVVADGMGGHQGGEEASRTAVAAMGDHFLRSMGGTTAERLRRAVHHANESVYRKALANEALRGMGTTCTAIAIKDAAAWLAHVGDSRAYHVTGDSMQQLSRDHTHVEEMVRLQLISRDEAAVHPQRHALLRSLGLGTDVEVDLAGPISLQPDDRFLLCSDGLGSVALDVVRDTVLTHPPQDACDRLIRLANEAGGTDNTTVLVIQVAGNAADNGHRRRWWTFRH